MLALSALAGAGGSRRLHAVDVHQQAWTTAQLRFAAVTCRLDAEAFRRVLPTFADTAAACFFLPGGAVALMG